MPTDARDGDDAVLEGLSERLEDGARELRQLVEEEHTVMREGDLAGTGIRASADDGRCRRAVVRSAER